MTKYERRRYEMFTRVQEFGKVHHEQFPDASAGRNALTALDAVVGELARLDAAKILAAKEGQQEKVAARQALTGQLWAGVRTARVLAKKVPGVEARFVMPRRLSDVTILSTARAFLSQAEGLNDAFVQHGLHAG